MKLSAREHWSENIGRLFGPSKKRYIWLLQKDSLQIQVELHVSHLSGKHRLFINEELLASQGGTFCGQEFLSAMFRGDEYSIKPLSASSQDYELDINGASFTRLFEIAEKESAHSFGFTDSPPVSASKKISYKSPRTTQPPNLNKSEYSLYMKKNSKGLSFRKPSQAIPPLSKKTSQSASTSNENLKNQGKKSSKGTTQQLNSSTPQQLYPSTTQALPSSSTKGVTEPMKLDEVANEFSLFNLSAPKRRMVCFESEIHRPPPERFDILRPDMPAPLSIDSLVVPKALVDAALTPLQSEILPKPQYFPTGSNSTADLCREIYADSD